MPAILHEPGARAKTAFMARTRLQRCPACLSYGFSRECACGEMRVAVAPLRFSPEDPQGHRRRQREGWGSEEWVKNLPTPRKEGDEEE